MREVDLEKLKAQIPERAFDKAHAASDWFGIAYDAGRARSLWNLLIALQDAEVDDFTTAYRIAEESHDLAHLCGLHKFRWRKSKWHELRMFLSFIYYSPALRSLKPGLREYIEHICENTRVRWGNSTKPIGLLDGMFTRSHDVTNTKLPWRTAQWLKERHERKRSTLIYEPVSEFYPYIARNPTDEHSLLLAVDKAVGQRLPEQWRGDFCQDLIVSILCGELTVENLHDEIPNYLTRFKREMPSKYKEISIDALIFSHNGGSGPTYGDRLVAKPDEDLADEELHGPKWTGRYGDALNDCETAEDLAERLQGAWDANRLLSTDRKTFSEFAKASGTDRSNEREVNRIRQKFGLVKGRVIQRASPDHRSAWNVETAHPDELREDDKNE